MEVINVDYVKLLLEAKSMGNKCSEIDKNIQTIVEVMEDIDIFWDGDSNEHYKLRFQEDIAFMETVILAIRCVIKQLIEIIQSYQETEKIVEQIIGGIKI